MATKVFINLPVKDLQFTDEKAACLVVNETIFVMLLTESYFQTFTRKKISDATQVTEVLIALDCNSREEVQQIINKAQANGAQLYTEPQDHGWMYQHSFADLDGHQWEFVYMDESQLPRQD
jgi:predicted lactoylglutathione lyase